MGKENIVTVIDGVSRKKGLFGLRRNTYCMVATEKRLIFARITKMLLAKQKEELNELNQQNKSKGKGFFARWGETMVTGLNWYDRYLTMDPEAVLAESEGNFFLKKSDIVSLKIRRHLGWDQGDPKRPLPFIKIKTRGEKYKFFLQRNYRSDRLKLLENWNRSS